MYLIADANETHWYIGSTVNMHNRLCQHNGILRGGAKYTEKGRNWRVVLLLVNFSIYEFGTSTEDRHEQSASEFEKSWLEPRTSEYVRCPINDTVQPHIERRTLKEHLEVLRALMKGWYAAHRHHVPRLRMVMGTEAPVNANLNLEDPMRSIGSAFQTL